MKSAVTKNKNYQALFHLPISFYQFSLVRGEHFRGHSAKLGHNVLLNDFLAIFCIQVTSDKKPFIWSPDQSKEKLFNTSSQNFKPDVLRMFHILSINPLLVTLAKAELYIQINTKILYRVNKMAGNVFVLRRIFNVTLWYTLWDLF